MHRMIVAVSALALSLIGGLGTAPADDHQAGTLTIEHPWARATAAQAANGAVYMTLVNNGSEPDRLLAGATPVAERVELHTHIVDGGVMRMRQVTAIEVAPGAPSVLAPGGLHVMLLGLKRQLVEGETFPLTLTFAHAGKAEVEVSVAAPGAMGRDRHDRGAQGAPQAGAPAPH